MTRTFNLALFIEVGLLIPTGFAIIAKMLSLNPMTAWLLMVLFNTTVLCIKYFKGVNSEIVKAICSIAISIILLINLASDQSILDAFALIAQSIFSALTIKNLIENYEVYK
ncbi:hypothetical protein [Acinetobacter bereziniae]|uniref:hypothetical protein n=1 Tax=Acinetobacter bereziniae TaxID=106648 RepID=UPI00124D96A5|nr:hypothetical protein [Acinetobacter bereziniae]